MEFPWFYHKTKPYSCFRGRQINELTGSLIISENEAFLIY